MLALLGFVTMSHNTVTWVAEDNVADGEERRKVAEANGTESAAPDVNWVQGNGGACGGCGSQWSSNPR